MEVAGFLASVFVYGCLGFIIEIFFTAGHALIFEKDIRAPGKTYLWMLPIYGLGAVTLGWLRGLIQNAWIFVPVAVLFIYLAEFTSGWLLRKITGKCPWDYGAARFGIAGLVRIDYMPFWLLVAIFFDRFVDYISKVLELVGSMA